MCIMYVYIYIYITYMTVCIHRPNYWLAVYPSEKHESVSWEYEIPNFKRNPNVPKHRAF